MTGRQSTERQATQAAPKRRAAAVLWTAITGTLMISVGALVVDLGYLRVVKGQLQNAADASALAGVSALLNPLAVVGAGTPENLADDGRARAVAYAARNKADGQPVHLDLEDIRVGRFDNPSNLDEPLTVGLPPYNALRVVTRKDESSPTGPVRLFLAGIMGKYTSNMTATATAYLDSGMVAYKPAKDNRPGPAIPITVHEYKWLNDIYNALGQDLYGYDPETGQVTLGPDGIPELSIFPEKAKDAESPDGAGNFGLLNFSNGNMGTTTIAGQIRTGLNAEEFTAAFGQPEARFISEDGSPVSHVLDGTPGVKNSLITLEDDVRSRIGTVVGFFIHDSVTYSGANIDYNVVNMQFGRVMTVENKGSVNGDKAIIIQPTPYLGTEIITDPGAPPHLTGGRPRIVR
ncbi:MAG: hypothetical protein GXY33_04690 [Phycisphaerae bacterium]|nr:hypothetical protein [Phycisphaerae bacterium]